MGQGIECAAIGILVVVYGMSHDVCLTRTPMFPFLHSYTLSRTHSHHHKQGGSAFGDWTVYDFYTDERVKLLYKAHLCAMVHRRNTVTGRLYRDDPTIFAWDLINEPRCSACPGPSKGDALQIWAAEMSTFLKTIDPNHMVTISSEGYYGEAQAPNMLQNPGLWAVCEGVDFER